MIGQAMSGQIDERYLVHRLKASSWAGVVGGLTASFLFVYYYFATDVARWDLLAVAVVIALVKLSGLAWYRITD